MNDRTLNLGNKNFVLTEYSNDTWPIWEFLIRRYNKEPVSKNQVKDYFAPVLLLNKKGVRFYIPKKN